MRKGFTLAEILAVIVVLAIIIVIVTPKVNKLITDAREKSQQNQIKFIYNATERYVTDNDIIITSSECIELSTLKLSGYIKVQDLKDVTNGESIDDYCVLVSLNNNQYSYSMRRNIIANVDANSRIINETWDNLKTISSMIAESGMSESSLVSSNGTNTNGLKIGDSITTDGIEYYVAGFNHDITNGETGITFIARYLENKAMNEYVDEYNSGTNNGGYDLSNMHTFLNSISLPVESKKVIKTIDQGTFSSGSPTKNGFSLKTSSEKLWLLSEEEVGFNFNDLNFLSNQGTIYPLFTDGTFRYKFSWKIRDIGGNPMCWWLRNSFTNMSDGFLFVDENGTMNGNSSAKYVYGVVFAFCI